MANKFLNLVESTIQRMTNGGILVGDRVDLVDNYKSKDSYKGLADTVKDYIEKIFKDTDLNKKVININVTIILKKTSSLFAAFLSLKLLI